MTKPDHTDTNNKTTDKNIEDGKKTIDLDDVLINEIGQIGPFQLRDFMLMSIFIVLNAFINDFNFTVANVPHRCRIPECGETSKKSTFSPDWITNAVPSSASGLESCHRFAPSSPGNGSLEYCPTFLFDNSTRVDCDGFVYARDDSAVYDFDLGCQEWMRVLAGTLTSVGNLISLPMSGYISDKFGRRVAMIFCMLNSGIFGIVKAFSVNYPMYLATQTIQAALGASAFTCVYILVTELVGPKYRVSVSVTCSALFAFGQIVMGTMAWLVEPWRILILALHVPCFISVGYYWLVSESPRWLLSKKKYEEATKVLRRVAETNKKIISEASLTALTKRYQDSNSKKTSALETVKAIVHSPALLKRVCTTPVWWVTANFVYYGLNINSVNLSDTMYLNYILTSAVEIPAYVLAVFILDRIGRKQTLSFAYLFSAACNIIFIFINKELSTWRLVVYLLGKFGISLVFSSLYLYTAELYPTEYRHRLMAFSAMIGRIGLIFAPLTPVFVQYWHGLPNVLFGGMGFISGVLVYTQPETFGARIPDTLAEAEAIGKPESYRTSS